MSFIGGKGLSTTHLLNLVANTLYNQFVGKDIKEFDGFNDGILDTFNTINMALPGKHYVAPSYKDVKDLFEKWKETNKEDQKKMFTKFINENVNLNKADESMLVTAIVAPPAAMMAKKAGQVVPQLALMNAIPDVVFVPSATLLALIAIKIIKLTFGNTTSKDTKSHVQPTPKQKLPTTTEFEKEPQIATEPTTEQEPQPTAAIEAEPQIATKQEPQATSTIEEPQIATEQEPQTTTAPTAAIEEPQIATEQEPQTTTAPTAAIEEPQIATEQEPQTTPAPTAAIEEPQIATEQEPQTTTVPTAAIEEPQTTTAPTAAIEEPQISTEQEPQTTTAPLYIPRHVHKDNILCPLCEELIAKAKKEAKRSDAVALKT